MRQPLVRYGVPSRWAGQQFSGEDTPLIASAYYYLKHHFGGGLTRAEAVQFSDLLYAQLPLQFGVREFVRAPVESTLDWLSELKPTRALIRGGLGLAGRALGGQRGREEFQRSLYDAMPHLGPELLWKYGVKGIKGGYKLAKFLGKLPFLYAYYGMTDFDKDQHERAGLREGEDKVPGYPDSTSMSEDANVYGRLSRRAAQFEDTGDKEKGRIERLPRGNQKYLRLMELVTKLAEQGSLDPDEDAEMRKLHRTVPIDKDRHHGRRQKRERIAMSFSQFDNEDFGRGPWNEDYEYDPSRNNEYNDDLASSMPERQGEWKKPGHNDPDDPVAKYKELLEAALNDRSLEDMKQQSPRSYGKPLQDGEWHIGRASNIDTLEQIADRLESGERLKPESISHTLYRSGITRPETNDDIQYQAFNIVHPNAWYKNKQENESYEVAGEEVALPFKYELARRHAAAMTRIINNWPNPQPGPPPLPSQMSVDADAPNAYAQHVRRVTQFGLNGVSHKPPRGTLEIPSQEDQKTSIANLPEKYKERVQTGSPRLSPKVGVGPKTRVKQKRNKHQVEKVDQEGNAATEWVDPDLVGFVGQRIAPKTKKPKQLSFSADDYAASLAARHPEYYGDPGHNAHFTPVLPQSMLGHRG